MDQDEVDFERWYQAEGLPPAVMNNSSWREHFRNAYEAGMQQTEPSVKYKSCPFGVVRVVGDPKTTGTGELSHAGCVRECKFAHEPAKKSDDYDPDYDFECLLARACESIINGKAQKPARVTPRAKKAESIQADESQQAALHSSGDRGSGSDPVPCEPAADRGTGGPGVGTARHPGLVGAEQFLPGGGGGAPEL